MWFGLRSGPAGKPGDAGGKVVVSFVGFSMLRRNSCDFPPSAAPEKLCECMYLCERSKTLILLLAGESCDCSPSIWNSSARLFWEASLRLTDSPPDWSARWVRFAVFPGTFLHTAEQVLYRLLTPSPKSRAKRVLRKFRNRTSPDHIWDFASNARIRSSIV